MAWDGVVCIERNTFITGYRVRYHSPSSDGTDEVSASGDGINGGSVTLTGLSPSTNYSIQVAADSDLGHGPFSDPITVVTDGEVTHISFCKPIPQEGVATTNQYMPACKLS